MTDKVTFISLTAAALLLAQIPIVHWPFAWLETFFHELSHGLTAILTGGEIIRIELHLRGSGLCYTRGGWPFLVLLSGYSGAVLWGGGIYLAARGISWRSASLLLAILVGILTVSTLLWVRDLVTLGIIIVFLLILTFQWRFRSTPVLQWLLKFSGLYVVLDAVRSPLALLDVKHVGDGAKLATQTGVPEIIWVGLWFSFGLSGLWYLWWITFRESAKETNRKL